MSTSYCHAVFGQPLSQYTSVFSVVLVVFAFCAFFFGAAYAPFHHDRVRYGPLEYFVGPIMLVAFLFFLGLRPSSMNTNSQSLILSEEDDAVHRRLQIARVVGVAIFGLGGLFLGISIAFFRWFDVSSSTTDNTPTTTSCPTLSPTKPSNTATSPIELIGPLSLVPAYALLVQVSSLTVAIVLAWLSVVFQEQEEIARRRANGDAEL